MERILNYFKNDKLKVRVKPNSSKTEIERYDDEKQVLIIRLNSPPDKGKANKELIKFLSKKTGKKITIKTGHTSRDKIISY